MNIVKPYAKMITPDNVLKGIDSLVYIETCGRVSHRSEDNQSGDSWKRFIEAVVLGHGDWSIVEHSFASCEFLVDRGITHELVRHRLFSFTQESTRFVNYEKKMPPSFIFPAMGFDIDSKLGDDFKSCINKIEDTYKEILNWCPPQIARSVFPNALASKIIISGNFRNWRHFFLMRTTKESHPQMREVTIPLLEQFKERIPLLFDDIEPLARQIDNMRKPR